MRARELLQAATPRAWIEAAATDWPLLLVDHANCEKKAASTALALMFAYPEDRGLSLAMARLAREELRHFEQVQKLMRELAVPMMRLAPGRYAGRLRARLAGSDPLRKRDLLLAGALIEARSCERFAAVAPALPEPLAGFYAALAEAEQRHALLYVELAAAAAPAEVAAGTLRARLEDLARFEARLVLEPDPEFRFHSGVPMTGAAKPAEAAQLAAPVDSVRRSH
ncbi:MAG TPA: tRNA isopentenyl-2-thiomethyl-A-37 hydroxylase MiaE [Steroidobacteraceae bacterium]|nr:tRNA isopentenyl-2-thiomethyl-A-37 hydroxylase MiaE [Steroidobacteraceae bacterium]